MIERMDGAEIVAGLLRESGLTKAELSRRSGVSRALIDAYLKGESQPSVAQVQRLSDGADLRIDFVWETPIPPVSERLVLVVELAHYLPKRPKPPLVNLGPIWRQCRERVGEMSDA